MKRLPIFLAGTALLALAACGSRATNNAAVIDTSNDVYNVSPDDLTVNDLGTDGNASTGGNSASGNASAGGNASSAASNSSGNSH